MDLPASRTVRKLFFKSLYAVLLQQLKLTNRESQAHWLLVDTGAILSTITPASFVQPSSE